MSKTKKRILIAAGIALAVLLLLAAGFVIVFDVPHWQRLDPQKLHALAQTSSIYDRSDALITEVRSTENRKLVSLEEIPRETQLAFIAAEDLRFYEHGGIDIYRIFGALRSNLITRSFSEGASTITQQLAKLTHLSAEKTVRRKLEEIWLALQIERAYSKDEILEMYLNTVYFGRGAYGIQAAARAYFGVDVGELTLAQSASLAAAIKAPSAYAPSESPRLNKSRRGYILDTMLENGFITEEAHKEAAQEEIWGLAREQTPQVTSW